MCFDVGYDTFSFVCVIGLIQSGVNFRPVQHKAKKRFIIEISFKGKKIEKACCVDAKGLKQEVTTFIRRLLYYLEKIISLSEAIFPNFFSYK